MMKTKFFFIKKNYKETEKHYWLNEENFQPLELTNQKVIDEFIALAFYRLIGIPTPKTYVGRNASQAVIISKLMSDWQPMPGAAAEMQVDAISENYIGLARLELGSAVLSDIDVSGWCFDNLGLKKQNRITKLDGGAAVVNPARKQYYLQFFQQAPNTTFPEGICTLQNDVSLNTTYLKIFKEENISKYHLHYFHLFDQVKREDRIVVLKDLFKIQREDLEKIMHKIPEVWYSTAQKEECINYLVSRIDTFRKTYAHHFTANELHPSEKLDYPAPFIKFLNQKYCEKTDWLVKYEKDNEYHNPYDFSQSNPDRYVKIS